MKETKTITYESTIKLVNTINKSDIKGEIKIIKELSIIEDNNLYQNDNFYQDKKNKVSSFEELLENINASFSRYLNIKNILNETNGKKILVDWGYANALEWYACDKKERTQLLKYAQNEHKKHPEKVKYAIRFKPIYQQKVLLKSNKQTKIVKKRNPNTKKYYKITDSLLDENKKLKKELVQKEKEIQKLKKENSELKTTIKTLSGIKKAS